ncbi:G-type lectin S-receptor-like serine/threonine-protein kinase At5g35370 [Apium graveolens]|uniref:G-type lectin S-receptor-like serine/threonine-protein kinase At5g35370 n=1 Tax=Apium graveolens TaxID=4045 RepID=UPI003D7AA089
MAFFIFFLSFSFSCAIVSGISWSEFLYPNFTASHYKFIDGGGSFLFSRNGSFKAAMSSPGTQHTRYYFCVIHVVSHNIIWSANREAPVSNSGNMILDFDGIKIIDEDGSLKWSTPSLKSSVSALELTDTGNLILMDKFNGTLWESFQYPTDTILIGQNLPIGTWLSSAKTDDDLSTGDYKLLITVSDAILQWQNQTYWKLSMATKAYTNSNYAVEYMAVNQTGLYLLGHNGSVVVIQLNLVQSKFRMAKLDASGQFIISSFSSADGNTDFVGPIDRCRIPFICGSVGLCTDDSQSGAPLCSCPSNFKAGSSKSTNCKPGDASYSLLVSCNGTSNSTKLNPSSLISYLRLGYGTDYFANDFTNPTKYGVDLTSCQDLCSARCSCLGIFFGNSSGSCYQVENVLGSFRVTSSSENDRLGFIKTVVGPPTRDGDDNGFSGQSSNFPIVALVLLPSTGFFLLVLLAFLWCRRSRVSTTGKAKINRPSSPSEDIDAFSIMGLPMRFDYEELEKATNNFKIKIGAGGFGTVYKGTLPDGTVVAVKKITNLGLQGKKDFCTEIAIIGNIHHVNLVKLKGFCAQGRERMLVYEYMNRGSLDCTLFGTGPVLEWQERLDIALGIARGLAYLHSGCEHKIIHCDVKPENILLQEQFQAKISDFGLSKLLSPEQSSQFTTMRGTRGYLAPEWLTSSAISDKTDVYSYGMVLLELVSGRKNCLSRTRSHNTSDDNSNGAPSSSSSTQGIMYFPLFALDMHEEGRYLELADLRLEGRVTSEQVEKLVRVALCCVHEEPTLRPNMGSVVSMLEGEIPLCQPSLASLNFLRFYGRRFAESSAVEQSSGKDSVTLFPKEDNSRSRANSASNTYFSYISSQQVSGPR